MSEHLSVTRAEALTMARLVNAYSSAQTAVEQLRPLLDSMGLLRANGELNADRVVLVTKAARGET